MIFVRKPARDLFGSLQLDGSKSISNRALIALALEGASPANWLSHLSSSKDTQTLSRLLAQRENRYDAGDAGTAFRFLTAYLAIKPGKKILTGSQRMLERPIGPLVDALRQLGADIQYLEAEGFPPLHIGDTPLRGGRIRIAAGMSSQFLSALLLIGPYLPGGLVLEPAGPLVSRPYLEMTLRLMQHFGAKADWQGAAIHVEPGRYTPQRLVVEADWSAASYWYAMAAFAEKVEMNLVGLQQESWQGDAALASLMRRFGVETTFGDNQIHLSKTGQAPRSFFEKNFLAHPDLAQTFAVICAGLGVNGLFSGLETLQIKETNRIAALKNELAKVGVSFAKLPARFSTKTPDVTFYNLTGRAALEAQPTFSTYADHRMALSFACFGMLAPVSIEQPEVVEKSYPQFWEQMRQLGFDLN